MPWAYAPRKRFERLYGIVQQKDLEIAVISDPKDIYYFTGFSTSPILFLPTYLFVFKDGSTTLVTGVTDASIAGQTYGGEIATYANYDLKERMLAYPGYVAGEVRKLLSQKNPSLRRLGIESWNLPHAILHSIKSGTRANDVRLVDLSESVQQFRATKDQDEINSIRRSCELDDFAYSVAKEESLPGRSEVEVYGVVQQELAKKVGSFQFFSGNFTSGERSLDPMGTGEPTPRVLREGETFVLDLWVTTKGYWADNCRTFVIGGKPTEEQGRVHSVLKRALNVGMEKLKPGIKAKDVYRAIFDVIGGAGWGRLFPHHAGHSVGLDAWEPPFIIPGSDDEIKEGMICALEPGVYIPEVGGIRIEDDYLVKRDGAERLTRFPLDL